MTYWWIIPIGLFLFSIGNIAWALNDRTKGFGDYVVSGVYSLIVMIIAVSITLGHFL